MPKDERSELVEAMRQVIIEANNSLYGSQSFFLTTKDGSVVGAVGVTGEPDKYHLAKKIEELKADARKSYRASLEPQAGMEWQPIETAPKDGTLVLLLVNYSSEDADHWIDDREDGTSRTIGHNNDDNVGPDEAQGWRFAGWCWCHDHYVEGKGQPTHWMPLPEPPSGEQ